MDQLSGLLGQLDWVYVDRQALTSQVGQRVLSCFPPERIEIVDAPPLAHKNGDIAADDFTRSKRKLYVTPHKGRFFKRCPGFKPGLSCCNYFVLNLGLQCNMNCSYCFLQSFINTPVLTVYSNIEDAISEIRTMAANHPELPYRVGTGETTDSLSLDPLTLYSRRLIEVMSEYPHWQIEFKTKSDYVEQFLDMPHAGNVIVSWSLNPQFIIDREEHLTTSLEARLRAAEKCLAKGFKVTFHLDPIIWHPQWQENYGQLVDQVCQRFTPQQIGTISIGTLRFQPEQRHMMRERFGFASLVTSAEMFRCRDGKFRYDSDLRNQMFQFVLNRFAQHSPQWRVSLCMETPESWLSSYQSSPRKVPGLDHFFRPLPTTEAAQRLAAPSAG